MALVVFYPNFLRAIFILGANKNLWQIVFLLGVNFISFGANSNSLGAISIYFGANIFGANCLMYTTEEYVGLSFACVVRQAPKEATTSIKLKDDMYNYIIKDDIYNIGHTRMKDEL